MFELSRLHFVQSVRRVLIFATMVTVLLLAGCARSLKETSMEATPDLAQAILALRGAYAAFNRGDIDAAVEPLDAQIEWTEPVEFPGGGTYHGREGAKRYLAQSRSSWAEVSSELERFITAGNRIIVFVHARVRAKDSKEWQEVRLADVYTIRDGKAVQMRAFSDRKEALRWAGVKDSSL